MNKSKPLPTPPKRVPSKTHSQDKFKVGPKLRGMLEQAETKAAPKK